MHEPSRAFLKRVVVTSVATAVVLGSTFVVGPIAATASEEPQARAAVSAKGHPAAPTGGLAEAVERDLGIGLEEFGARGDLSAQADSLRRELQGARLKAFVFLAGNGIKVQVEAADRAAVTRKLHALTKGNGVELDIDSPVASAASSKRSPASVDELYRAYSSSVDAATLNRLQAVVQTANGFVIRTGGASTGGQLRPAERTVQGGGTMTPEEFAFQYPDVDILEAEGPATVTASNDVLGGMGYGAEIGPDAYTLCSVGFNAFNGAGAPAVLSAGHCTRDGQVTKVSVAEHGAPDVFEGLGAPLGSFGFSQFGGPGNTALTVNGGRILGNVGTDVSVMDKINPALKLQPRVTDWSGFDERDSGTKVTGVASAVVGTNICKSGRTTGWTCGTVDEVGIFVVGGFMNSATDLRGIRGFGMANPGFAKAYEGDSGGSVIAGGNAVGLTSAISREGGGRAYFSDINQALKQAKGYSVGLFINAPKFTAPAQGAHLEAGRRISGTLASAPSGSTVEVFSSGKKIATATTAKGMFSFKSPKKLGDFGFTLQAVNGFSKSRLTAGSVVLDIPAPKITAPKSGTNFGKRATQISGTGFPAATVKLSGAVTGTAVVDDNGKWSRKTAALAYGAHKITASQSMGSNHSRKTTVSFKVAVPAPVFTTTVHGSVSPKSLRTIAGTGIPGAGLQLSGSVAKNLTIAKSGKWSVKMKGSWSYGKHGIRAVQTVGKHTSASARLDFKVVPAAPKIESPSAGKKFRHGLAPKTISGRGVAGATVKVALGKTRLSATVVKGSWKVRVPGTIRPGTHTASAVQVIKKVSSAATEVTFSIAKPSTSSK